MYGRGLQLGATAWASGVGLLLLALLTSTAAYQGFDCGQGTALLKLSSHSQCGPSSHLACFSTVAMRVKKCNIKAWPHPAHKRHKPCLGIRLLANVTDVNNAHGTINGPLPGSTGHVTMPVSFEFRRLDELMHVRYGECTLRFDVRTASDASLRPVPGEEGGVSALLVLLLPAILVPCMCVGLILAVGSISAQRIRAESRASGGGGDGCLDEGLLAAAYSALASGPDSARSGGPGYRMPPAAQSQQGALGLITRTFNLKAMSRRAQARRLRRSARPVYVGLPQECAAQQQMYATGTLQPGPNCLVAPCFRFPPVTMPPGLDSIDEAGTPCSGSSAAPSRSSSCQEMTPVAEAEPAPSPATWSALAADAAGNLEGQAAVEGAGGVHNHPQEPLMSCSAAPSSSSHAWSATQQLQHSFAPSWFAQQRQQEAGKCCNGAC
uniref:Uncharacterized protein n=1 Tax=Tetradesmus obliquus TaxID=3088 RepID=A0A383VLF5_TETOB|eukprot:jgi/Sobl393_1/13337/SZX64784.1